MVGKKNDEIKNRPFGRFFIKCIAMPSVITRTDRGKSMLFPCHSDAPRAMTKCEYRYCAYFSHCGRRGVSRYGAFRTAIIAHAL